MNLLPETLINNKTTSLKSGMGFSFVLSKKPDSSFYFSSIKREYALLISSTPDKLLITAEPFFDLFLSQHAKSLKLSLLDSNLAKNNFSWIGQLNQVCSSNSLKWVSISFYYQKISSSWNCCLATLPDLDSSEWVLQSTRRRELKFSMKLEKAREREKEHIAREVHDDLGSLLVRAKIESSLLSKKLDTLHTESMKSIIALVDSAINTTQQIARQLKPGILKEFGLLEALKVHIKDFEKSTNIRCTFNIGSHNINPSDEVALTLFRVTQEALTNIAKHAKASQAEIKINVIKSNINISIEDNGCGIKPQDLKKGHSLGIQGMKERIQTLSGDFELANNSQEKGVVVNFTLPEKLDKNLYSQLYKEVQQKLF